MINEEIIGPIIIKHGSLWGKLKKKYGGYILTDPLLRIYKILKFKVLKKSLT